jgi:hypothetical protein
LHEAYKKAKKIFSTELGKKSPPETAFLSIISTSKEVRSGKDISQLAKAALRIVHSDKQGTQHADELTKKRTDINSATQRKSLDTAKQIVE